MSTPAKVEEHECSVSTGIHDGLTFGTGELDFNGYWEHPCHECARKWEKAHPEYGPCWPFEEEIEVKLTPIEEKKP